MCNELVQNVVPSKIKTVAETENFNYYLSQPRGLVTIKNLIVNIILYRLPSKQFNGPKPVYHQRIAE